VAEPEFEPWQSDFGTPLETFLLKLSFMYSYFETVQDSSIPQCEWTLLEKKNDSVCKFMAFPIIISIIIYFVAIYSSNTV
jgi:hypothetical protein